MNPADPTVEPSAPLGGPSNEEPPKRSRRIAGLLPMTGAGLHLAPPRRRASTPPHSPRRSAAAARPRATVSESGSPPPHRHQNQAPPSPSSHSGIDDAQASLALALVPVTLPAASPALMIHNPVFQPGFTEVTPAAAPSTSLRGDRHIAQHSSSSPLIFFIVIASSSSFV